MSVFTLFNEALAASTPPGTTSNKVTYPGYVGLGAFLIVCTAQHYGIQVPAATAVGAVVLIMTTVGYLARHFTASASATVVQERTKTDA